MSLEREIKRDWVKAAKEFDIEVESTLRRLAVEEIGSVRTTEDLSDEVVVGIVQKMVDDARELGNDSEVNILEKYLPDETP